MSAIDHTATTDDVDAAVRGDKASDDERVAGAQLLRLMWGIQSPSPAGPFPD